MSKLSFKNSFIILTTAVLVVSGFFVANSAHASSFYSLGDLSLQNGWDGGVGGSEFTNNNADSNVITNADKFTGTQSWLYGGSYSSPGAGTPFTPDVATVGALNATDAGSPITPAGNKSVVSFAFKAIASGDGSKINIYEGSYARNERTGASLYLQNDSLNGNPAGTVSLYNFSSDNNAPSCDTTQVNLGSVTAGEWHTVEMTTVYPDLTVGVPSTYGSTTYVFDKGMPSEQDPVTMQSWMHAWRNCSGINYVPGGSLKFSSSFNDYPTHKGFYIDDVSMQVINTTTPVASFATSFEAASDTSALDAAKLTAQGLIDANAVESTITGDHVIGSLAILASANTAANATNASAQSVVDGQVSTLNDAISAYNLAIVPFNFVEYAGNPLFGGATSGLNKAYQPYVIKIGEVYNMWYGDGENARYISSAYPDFHDATFPGTIVIGTTASQPYKFTVYYNSNGWTLGDTHYSQKLVAYYTDLADNWTANPKIAVSDDGITWTYVGQTTGVIGYPVGDSSTVYRLSIVYEGLGVWKGYGDDGGATIQYYTSTNGISWTGVASDILKINNPQSWESSSGAISPYVFKMGDTYAMTYSAGKPNNDQAIGIAYSSDGINWAKSSTNPIFSINDDVAWRTIRTYNSYITYVDGLWRMYFQGRDADGNYSIGMATSGTVSSSDATLNASSKVKGETLLGLGTPNVEIGSATGGTVTISSAKAADTSEETPFVTSFIKTDSGATVNKIVKYANDASIANFATEDTPYSDAAITDQDFFIIKVTAADTSTILYYKVVVTVAPADTYTVTFDKQEGSGTTDPISGVASGATVTLPTNPTKIDYTFNNWKTAADGSGTTFDASTAVVADVTVYAQWTAISSPGGGVPYYSVSASAGANGSISPTGATSLASGANQTYTITPAVGYQIADVLVDGTSVGTVTTYTFSNVTTGHTISATFAVTGIVSAASTIIGDINGDGKINEYDFAIMMSEWGETGPNLSADLNHDGVVDELDFSILMADWGL